MRKRASELERGDRIQGSTGRWLPVLAVEEIRRGRVAVLLSDAERLEFRAAERVSVNE